MGEIELNNITQSLLLTSHIITYGTAASNDITESIREEIESMWNEPHGQVTIKGLTYTLRFKITAAFLPNITPEDVYRNLDARNNYFRIEHFAAHNISFVDGLGSNTGYFLLENLYRGSTTAAHEFGHTLGLPHPSDIDFRTKGIPGIMYPRGTLVDPPYQYDPSKPAGVTGGTMHPVYRKVRQTDIDDLKISRLRFQDGKSMIGEFTNVYHWNHAEEGSNISS